MKLMANMIVRNEVDNYLEQVLLRLREQVDEIIITDDCSDDETVDLCKDLGAQVTIMDKPTFVVHEGQLRQASWEYFETFVEPHQTWCLAIDADEELYPTKYSLDQLINNPRFDVYNVDFYHMWNETQYRIDKAWRPHGSTRMFRYFPNGKFKDRKMACGAEPTFVNALVMNGKKYHNTGLKMKHLSYIKDEDKQLKYDRYVELDGGAFHANQHIQSILDPIDNVVLADWNW